MSISFGLLKNGTIAQIIKRHSHRAELVRAELAKATNKAAREVINLSCEEWDSMMTAPGYLKSRVAIVSAASPNKLVARIRARERATRANRFRYNVMPNKAGVYLNVRRGRAGGVLPNTFVIPRARSDGRPLILERKRPYQRGESRNFKGGRFRAIYGPSANQFFYDSRLRVAPKALSEAKKQFLGAIRDA